MYDDRCSPEFINGVHTFLLAAEANKRADGFMPCPCAGCKNGHNYSTSRTIHVHLFESGFMPHYNVWTKHGERGVMMEDNEEGDDFIDESYLAHFGDTFMEDAEGEGEGEEEARDDPVDDLGRTIADARRRCETEKERENLDRMLEDHRKSLYPGCDDGLKKLGYTCLCLPFQQIQCAAQLFQTIIASGVQRLSVIL